MQYFGDLQILQASIEALKPRVFHKVSNDPKILVVGVFNEDGGQRTAGIQLGKEISEFWEVKALDCQPSQDLNNFVSDRMGRSGSREFIKDNIKYFLRFKHVNVQIKAVYHTQSLTKLFSTVNKWTYWNDKLAFKLDVNGGIFEINIVPDEVTPIPSKNLEAAENCKMEINFSMRTFAGIIYKANIMKTINFNTNLATNENITDNELIVIDDNWKPRIIEDI